MMALIKRFVTRIQSPDSSARDAQLSSPGTEVARLFADEIDGMENEEPPRLAVSTFYFASLMFVLLVLISAYFEIDVVVTGSGELVLDGKPVTIQPIERSIVKSVDVKPGDRVTKGQIVARLDPTFAAADLRTLQGQQHYQRALAMRLEAEARGEAPPEPKPSDEHGRLQFQIYNERQAQYLSRLKAFDSELASIAATADTISGNLVLLTKQMEIATEVEDMRRGLYENKVGTRLLHLEAQSHRLRMTKEHDETRNRRQELELAMAARSADRQAFLDDWRRQILEELGRARAELARLDEAISKSARLNTLVELTSPVDGIVSEVAALSTGAVARDAEPLMVIMPVGGNLLAEVYIKSSDVGNANVGDRARIKVDAYPYHRYGTLDARIIWISGASYSPQFDGDRGLEQPRTRPRLGGEAMHRVRMELVATRLKAGAKEVDLTAGLKVTGDIKLRTRTMLSYLAEPLRRGLEESLREP